MAIQSSLPGWPSLWENRMDTARILLDEWIEGLPLDVSKELEARLAGAYREGGEAMRRAAMAVLQKDIARDEYEVKTAKEAYDRSICRILLEQHRHSLRDVEGLPPVGL